MEPTLYYGYCREVADAMPKLPALQLSFLRESPFYLLVMIILLGCTAWASDRFRRLISFVKIFDVNPQWIHIYGNTVGDASCIRSKTAAGGIASLTLLISAVVLCIWCHAELGSPTTMVQMEPLRMTDSIQYLAKLRIPCGPTSYNCSQMQLLLVDNPYCIQYNGMCYMEVTLNYNQTSSQMIELTMPSNNVTNQVFEIQLYSNIIGASSQNTRHWDPSFNPRDFWVFTDSCLSIQSLPLGRDIGITIDAAVRRNCQQINGPRFACGATDQSDEYKEAAIAFDPMVEFHSSSNTVLSSSSASVKIKLNFNPQVQLSTALTVQSWTSNAIKLLPIVLAIFGFAFAVHPIARNTISYIVDCVELHQSVGAIASSKALHATFSFVMISSCYSLFALLVLWLEYESICPPLVLQYSTSLYHYISPFGSEDDYTPVIRSASFVVGVLLCAFLSFFVFVLLKQGVPKDFHRLYPMTSRRIE